ncbi:MAG: hypothetical protein O2931_13345 [Planctomycetota bacterium]|nr:hypothetical protein [Planctomycetota bacterium]MDA1179768.1 hypothetical protein [Planctomycetota bacterium]
MSQYGTLSDDYYVNLNLNTEMDLPSQRETVLHFFEQMQKRFPTMKNFYSRERGEFVLEEDKEQGHYRWASIEARRVSGGYVNPASVEQAMEQHRTMVDLMPHLLCVSRLDCESLNLTFGFDFNYRGNHNEIVAEALGVPPAVEKIVSETEGTVVSYEPAVQLAIGKDCRTQVRVGVETRTSAYHVRTGEFPEEQISVYLTARRYGSLEPSESFEDVIEHLYTMSVDLIDRYVVDNVLRPLQQAIAIR